MVQLSDTARGAVQNEPVSLANFKEDAQPTLAEGLDRLAQAIESHPSGSALDSVRARVERALTRIERSSIDHELTIDQDTQLMLAPGNMARVQAAALLEAAVQICETQPLTCPGRLIAAAALRKAGYRPPLPLPLDA